MRNDKIAETISELQKEEESLRARLNDIKIAKEALQRLMSNVVPAPLAHEAPPIEVKAGTESPTDRVRRYLKQTNSTFLPEQLIADLSVSEGERGNYFSAINRCFKAGEIVRSKERHGRAFLYGSKEAFESEGIAYIVHANLGKEEPM